MVFALDCQGKAHRVLRAANISDEYMSEHTTPPRRGFTRSEFENRLERAQAAMARDELDALVVTAPPNVRYFSGFATQFWESPTRPWFLVVPREGQVIAVIPKSARPAWR